MSPIIYPAAFIRRNTNENCYYSHKDNIIKLHSSFNKNLLNTDTKITIIDSHRAYLYYKKNHDKIVFDTHFLDILRLVTVIMLSENGIKLIDGLANLCSADYFICKDEIYLSLKYSDEFLKSKTDIEQLINKQYKNANELFYTQLMFLLSHEQVHGLLNFDKTDERFKPFKELFDDEFEQIASITEIIHNVDLSPIKSELDKLDKNIITEDFDYSLNNIHKLFKYKSQLQKIIDLGTEVLNIQEANTISKQEIVLYACEMYLKNAPIRILNKEQYEDECLCDGYSLFRIISCKMIDDDIVKHIKKCIFAYYSCLLTMNIITCVNACVMNYRTEGYNDEDFVWNRLRLERSMFNNIIRQYTFRKPEGFYLAMEVFGYAESLVEKYNVLYARFCDKLFSIEHPTEYTPYCSCGCKRYDELYNKVCKNLSINLKINQ